MTNTADTITTSAWNTNTLCWEVIEIEPAGDVTHIDDTELTAEDFGGVAGQTYRVALLDQDGTEMDAREIVAGPVTYVGLADLAAELDVTRETIDTLAGQINDDLALYDPATERVTEAGAELIRDQVRSGGSVGAELDEVVDAAQALAEAKSRRDAAVRAAFDEGVPRTRIAVAAGVNRSRVYQICEQEDR